MISDEVQVFSRRSDAAASATLTLEFGSGLAGRPLLRPARKDELLVDGGTRVRLKLRADPREKGGLLRSRGEEKKDALSLASLCRTIAPAIEVDLHVSENGKSEKVISASDWIAMPGERLMDRMRLETHGKQPSAKDVAKFKQSAAKNLRELRDERGDVIGRACISLGWSTPGRFDMNGVVTVGGLRSVAISGICGIMLGEPRRAARDNAVPVVSLEELKRWAEEQADLVPNLWPQPEHQTGCAQYIRLCGGSTKKLRVAAHKGKWVSVVDIAGMKLPDVVILINDYTIRDLQKVKSFKLDANVFVVYGIGMPVLLQTPTFDEPSWPVEWHGRRDWRKIMLEGAIIEAIAQAWNVAAERVYSANKARSSRVRIGALDSKPYMADGMVIKRPAK